MFLELNKVSHQGLADHLLRKTLAFGNCGLANGRIQNRGRALLSDLRRHFLKDGPITWACSLRLVRVRIYGFIDAPVEIFSNSMRFQGLANFQRALLSA